MPLGIGFDVYGTLVDPLEMNGHLRPVVGDLADRFAEIWREKQVEYAFRRGLMGRYEDFGVYTRQALRYAMSALKIDLPEEDQEWLMSEYQRLEAFPDGVAGLETLKSQGHQLAAFSNGAEATVRSLLDHAAILPLLDQVVIGSLLT
jgi:2-haloacid dehalogenase